MNGDEKSLKVDSPIWDNQVIGNSYLRISENRKTRYGESHIGKSVTINNLLRLPIPKKGFAP